MKIGIVGWNGKKNVGDDVMTSVIINYFIGRYGDDLEFRFFAGDNNLAEYMDSDRRSIITTLSFYDIIDRVKLVRRFFMYYVYPKIFVNNLDIIIIGGGSIIHNVPTSTVYSRIIDAAKKATKNIRVASLGVSIGPFKKDNEYYCANMFLRKLDSLVVRDKRSLTLGKEMELRCNVSLAADLAFLLPKFVNLDTQRTPVNFEVMGISLRSGYFSTDRRKKYKSIVEHWLNADNERQVWLFSFSELPGQSDYLCCEELCESVSLEYRNRIKFIRYSLNPIDFFVLIRQCTIILCMRLHAFIIGYAVKTPVLVDAYHQKCIDLSLDLGIESSFLIRDKTPNEIMDLVHTILENGFEFKKYENIVDDALVNFEYFEGRE
ncbi:Polysaccharide pyruvyl transferase family protein WcaK [Cyclobacterium xiamenense]|uniref:Polysaccharide pyruvyl transferase family protein WcaK n=1 Tax=Cyclobacterium xiamenense TaxID=1297121 RepID=A0A1H6ZAW5_9BACT|nr:polysaccharide pyruvyl transferase family protein [Cyclobacterium xiamenense]SEJ50703.1 Polysaccharide pyruvyl transferase family protein WcaK [Cyclobacterium xiamenense]